jgi:DNA ligase (NAD+)
MNKIERIQELTKQLNQYRNEYYNQNKSSVSDSTYDKLFDELSLLEKETNFIELSLLEKETNFILSNSPTQSVGFEVVSKLQKVTHKTPLLSLDKTKSIDELYQWRKYQNIILMLKADGLTIELDYDNGILNEASTRGNGEIGEIVTHNAFTFKNLPKNIPFNGKLRLSGEAIIHWDDFNEINSKLPEEDKHATPRNLVSGSVRQLDSKICSERNVYFYSFNILECSEELKDSKMERFNWLNNLGFKIVPTLKIYHYENLEMDIEDLKKIAEKWNIPIDGLVASFDSVDYSNSLNITSHHPLHSLALKFKDETEDSILRQVEWNTTRSGQINPTAIFDTVELDNTEVSRASLFNLTFIEDLKLNIGCRIKVSKRNMIIPYIEENLDKNNGELETPKYCPSCGEKTLIENAGTSDFLRCINKNCPAQLLDKFVHFVSRDAMNIDGLSEATLEKFINKGFIKTFSDIYRLEQYKSQIVNMDGFGQRSYSKLIEAIEKSKNVKFEQFVYGLGIDQIGKGGAKRLSKHFNNDINRFLDTTDSYDEFLKIEDFGDITAQAVINYFQDEDNMEQVDRLLMHIKIIKPEIKSKIIGDNLFKGTKVYATGKFANYKKEEIKKVLEDLGAEFTSGYAKSLNYLIVGSIEGSSKEDKAKADGVKILGEVEFMKMIGKE